MLTATRHMACRVVPSLPGFLLLIRGIMRTKLPVKDAKECPGQLYPPFSPAQHSQNPVTLLRSVRLHSQAG